MKETALIDVAATDDINKRAGEASSESGLVARTRADLVWKHDGKQTIPPISWVASIWLDSRLG